MKKYGVLILAFFFVLLSITISSAEDDSVLISGYHLSRSNLVTLWQNTGQSLNMETLLAQPDSYYFDTVWSRLLTSGTPLSFQFRLNGKSGYYLLACTGDSTAKFNLDISGEDWNESYSCSNQSLITKLQTPSTNKYLFEFSLPEDSPVSEAWVTFIIFEYWETASDQTNI